MKDHLDIHVHLASTDDVRRIEHSLAHVTHLLERIMSKIGDFATAQNAFNDRIDTAVSGLTADIAELNAEILKLQNTSGEVTPEDQALLDGIQARSSAIADKLDALDQITPPVPPA